jgi:hypothetical protein
MVKKTVPGKKPDLTASYFKKIGQRLSPWFFCDRTTLSPTPSPGSPCRRRFSLLVAKYTEDGFKEVSHPPPPLRPIPTLCPSSLA